MSTNATGSTAHNGEYCDIGFARLDLSRTARTGIGETIYGPGKTADQLLEIFEAFKARSERVIATRCTAEQAEVLRRAGLDIEFDPVSKLIKANWGESHTLASLVAICTGGTADLPVAEEAAQCAEFFGLRVERYFDVGVAGLHRLLDKIESIRKADVVIAVAGMEGALGSVITGLVAAPVIAVPTSVGYGVALEGVTPLLAMMSSCAEGMAVVNINNGFGAAVMARRIAGMKGRQ